MTGRVHSSIARTWLVATAVLTFTAAPASLFAQAPLPLPAAPYERPATPPSHTPAELDRLVSPIALYPDPLIVNVLTAATYPDDIIDAARWSDDHHHLTDGALTAAMAADNIPWNAAVQALLPFPSVLEMMARDMPWTEELGDAFLADEGGVMAAVQRLRLTARDGGYLRDCSTMVVSSGPYVELTPADAAFITVPYYFPKIFFEVPPVVSVYCGFGIRLGAWFAPWGWGETRIAWADGLVVVNGFPWGRTWMNRDVYVHPYHAPIFHGPRPPEQHPLRPRTPAERRREGPANPPRRAPSEGKPPARRR